MQRRLEGQSAYLVPCAGRPAIEHSPTFPCDCCTRLSRLLAVHWLENTPALVAALRARVEESKTRCLGFCQSCYLCRLHCAPAIINEGRHPSRYQCLVDDHASTPRGRHHADFLFYCDRPECCNGKWFARDETHARTLRKRGITHTDAVRPLTATEERLFAERRRAAPPPQLAVPQPSPAVFPLAYAMLPIVAPSAPSIETVLGNDAICPYGESSCVSGGNGHSSGNGNSGNSSSNSSGNASGMKVAYNRLLGTEEGGRGTHKGSKINSRSLSLASFTCRARVAVVLAVCVVAAAALGAVLATRRARAGALGPPELQLCWHLAWAEAGARAATQGCRVCARSGTAYVCRSAAAARTLTLEAALSASRGALARVRLRTAGASTLLAADAVLPWTFSSADAAPAEASEVAAAAAVSARESEANTTDLLPDVWYGFILAVGT